MPLALVPTSTQNIISKTTSVGGYATVAATAAVPNIKLIYAKVENNNVKKAHVNRGMVLTVRHGRRSHCKSRSGIIATPLPQTPV